MVINTKGKVHLNEIIEKDTSKMVLIEFGAEWCGPCRIMEPIMENIEQRTGIPVCKIDTELYENKELAEKYHVTSLPTIVLVKGYETLWTQMGVTREDEILNQINIRK